MHKNNALKSIKLQAIAILLTVLTVFGSSAVVASPGAGDFMCNLLLTLQRMNQRAPVAGPMDGKFNRDPSLIYNNPSPLQHTANPFYASNEFDYVNTPWDTTETDLLMGIGTNSAWDLALRKNAKEMVIADVAMGPLVGQRYLMLPIFKIAKTPSAFLSFILTMDLFDTKSATEALAKAKAIYRRNARVDSRAVRERIDQAYDVSTITEDEYVALSAHYEGPANNNSYGIFEGRQAAGKGLAIGQHFFERYEDINVDPRQTNPLYSFLNSKSSYTYVRNLFVNGNVNYALADFEDEAFYQLLKARGDAKGYRNYTFSITNIIDAEGPERSQEGAYAHLQRYRNMLNRVFPAPYYGVVVFMTTNWLPPHGFIRLDRNTDAHSVPWIFDSDPNAGDRYYQELKAKRAN